LLAKTALAGMAATAARCNKIHQAKFGLRMVTEDAAGTVQL